MPGGAVISSSLVLAAAGFTLDHPIVGWRNIVTPSNVFPESEAVGFPGTNLANPATFLKWKSASTADQNVRIAPGGETVNYIAIAKHNLATAGYTVFVHDGTNLLTPLTILPNNGPAIFRFNPVTVSNLYLAMTDGGSTPPEIAVMYAGQLLVLERRIYAGHTPMPHGRTWKATNGMSESGQFLGRIVTQEFVKTKIPLSLLSPTWFRENLNPFLDVAQEIPFFFAWRPQTYPFECGYGWLTAEPAPVPTAPSNLISLTLDVAGVR